MDACALQKNKAQECIEVTGLKATTSRQTTIHNLFPRIDYLTLIIIVLTSSHVYCMCKYKN